MSVMVERTCRCGKKFKAKASDVARGYGKSCSKSCAASAREKKTGNYARYMNAKQERERKWDQNWE